MKQRKESLLNNLNNSSIVSIKSLEFFKILRYGLYSSSYTARYRYLTKKSDGGVIGPFSGNNYRIFIDRSGNSTIDSDTLSLGNLNSFVYWSKDNSSFSLGDVDNFTIGFKTKIDCTN